MIFKSVAACSGVVAPHVTMKHKKNEKHFRRDKLVVTYDEDARKEYLTGFRKRKQQRRKDAQDKIQQRLKDEKRAEKAEQRKAAREELTTTIEYDIPGPLEADAGDAAATAEFADAFSKKAFGAQSVVVTTTLGAEGLEDGAADRMATLKALAMAHRKTEERQKKKAAAGRAKNREDNGKTGKGKHGKWGR